MNTFSTGWRKSWQQPWLCKGDLFLLSEKLLLQLIRQRDILGLGAIMTGRLLLLRVDLCVAGTAAAGVEVGVLAGPYSGLGDDVYVCSRRGSVASVADVSGA